MENPIENGWFGGKTTLFSETPIGFSNQLNLYTPLIFCNWFTINQIRLTHFTPDVYRIYVLNPSQQNHRQFKNSLRYPLDPWDRLVYLPIHVPLKNQPFMVVNIPFVPWILWLIYLYNSISIYRCYMVQWQPPTCSTFNFRATVLGRKDSIRIKRGNSMACCHSFPRPKAQMMPL